MKFFGTPNQLVKEKRKKPYSIEIEFKPIFRFDSNGEYTTEDQRLIEKLKRKFRYEDNVTDDKPIITCKKCGETFESKGLLLAHYKKEHPKE